MGFENIILFQITWLDAHNAPIKNKIETIVETLEDGKRKTVRSILRLLMTRSHHNTSLTCEAQNCVESSPSTDSIILMVQFAPVVSVKQTPVIIREGDTVIVRCQVTANPHNITYQWFVGTREHQLGGEPGMLVLPGVGRDSHGWVVRCRASNSVGVSEASTALNVTCEYTQ